MKIKAMKIDDSKTAITVIGRYFMNWPTIPGQNRSGRHTINVVTVDEMIGYVKRRPWTPLCIYGFSSDAALERELLVRARLLPLHTAALGRRLRDGRRARAALHQAAVRLRL